MGASPRSGSQGADVITAKLCPCGSWSPEWWGRDTNPSSSTVKALAGLRGNAVYLFLHIHLPGNRPQLEAPGLKLWERPSFGRAYTARSGRHRQIHEARYAHTITDIPSISFEKNREKRSSVLSINFPSWTRGSWGQAVRGLPQTLRDLYYCPSRALKLRLCKLRRTVWCAHVSCVLGCLSGWGKYTEKKICPHRRHILGFKQDFSSSFYLEKTVSLEKIHKTWYHNSPNILHVGSPILMFALSALLCHSPFPYLSVRVSCRQPASLPLHSSACAP